MSKRMSKDELVEQIVSRYCAGLLARGSITGLAREITSALRSTAGEVEAKPATDDAIAIVAEALAEADGLPSFAKAKVVVAALRRAGVMCGD